MAQHAFGWQHIIYLIASLGLSFLGWFYFYKKVNDEKKKDFIIKLLGIILLVMVILNRILVSVYLDEPFMPHSWCSAFALFLGIGSIIFKRNSDAIHYLAPTAFISGLLPTILAPYLDEGFRLQGCTTILFPPTITSLIFHSFMLFISVTMFIFGYIKPTYKKWYTFFLGYGVCMLYGIFYLHFIGFDAVNILGDTINVMNINAPAISIFDAAMIFPFAIIVYVLYLFVYYLIDKKKAKNN